ERFHGTMYRTFGSSRLPVMSVASSSSRSGPLCAAAFALAVLCPPPVFAASAADRAADGAAVAAGAGGAAVAAGAGDAADGAVVSGAAGAAAGVSVTAGAAGTSGVVLTPGS